MSNHLFNPAQLSLHNKMNLIMDKVAFRDVPKYGSVVDTRVDANSIEYCVGNREWYFLLFSDLPIVLQSIPILSMKHTDFRAEITALLNEYDMYTEQANTSPRVDLEDSVDELFNKLTKEA